MERRILASLALILLILLSFRPSFADAETTNTTLFSCSPDVSTPCRTFAVYRTQAPGFLDIGSISDLFGISRLMIANANNLSSEEGTLLPGQLLLVPITCGCTGNQSFANITYLINAGDNFFLLSIHAFENLTDYHAIEQLSPELDPTKLKVRQEVLIPLYCKCPTQKQQDQGIQILITYVWQAGDDISELSKLMNSSADAIAAENNYRNLSAAASKPILIPVSRPPQLPQLIYHNVPASRGRARSNRPVVIACTMAAVLLLACILLYVSILSYRKHRSKKASAHAGSNSETTHHDWIKNPYGLEVASLNMIRGDKLLTGVSQFIDKPVIFEVEEIMEATMNLDESYRIGGSYFRAKLDGEVFAVKQAKGDVSSELRIMQMVNHANLIKLAGVSVSGEGDHVFLVYELAENGSLDKWLYRSPSSSASSSSVSSLSWTQRLNIALDVANGLLYMHEHTQPSIVHGDVRARSILLTADFKAKIAKFPMAKPAMADAAMTSGDVFAFGLVLLELLSGRTATEARGGTEIRMVLESGEKREARLRKWMDPVLGSNYRIDAAVSLANMARACTEENPAQRPRMSEIVFGLSVLTQSSSADAGEKLWLASSEENIPIANTAVAAR